ncbi:MAG: type VI secretion protein [Gammaproteobacteria bacterium]|nr:MAG: type VI secretion protein [Gammaproteobacteria bacterium]
MGKPAARITDFHICPGTIPKSIPHVGGPVVTGAPTVIICGMPAARVGDMLICMGPPDTVSSGSSSVIIAGQPAARMLDSTSHGGKIITGAPTVLIG